MSDSVTPERLERAYQLARFALLAERTAEGCWVGELSTSALSTAVAVSALALVQRVTARYGDLSQPITGGIAWLADHQNADGGWGDTVASFSNISTSTLCRAAFGITGLASGYPQCLEKADGYLRQRCGDTSAQLAEAIRRRYGKDRTFSVPILMTAALAGMVPWSEVPSLPFELACFPQSWFRLLQLPVVSYALPALIAIGQAVYHHQPPWNPLTRLTRHFARGSSLRVLQTIQPSNGGFLEATPLTSFVTLGLASIGQAEHPVVARAVGFILDSIRPDGSWPIDTNLSTWVTTLSINALAVAGDLDKVDGLPALRDWLLRQQYRERHTYTGAAPGAWAWTPLPGGVPDADDTPGALLALHHLPADGSQAAALAGLGWIVNLQNGDDGWPTFCRGWTNLAFDRSGADLTAHCLRALEAWQSPIPGSPDYYWSFDLATERGFDYLARQQRADGSWLPLWFGNQHAPDDENPTYGTARVLAAYRDCHRINTSPARRGFRWLLSCQNADGGWGGAPGTPSSIEETALAVEVLLAAGAEAGPAVNKGLYWLVQQVESGGLARPTPIGFYFAKLWYFEKLYPIIFSVAALGRARTERSAAD